MTEGAGQEADYLFNYYISRTGSLWCIFLIKYIFERWRMQIQCFVQNSYLGEYTENFMEIY